MWTGKRDQSWRDGYCCRWGFQMNQENDLEFSRMPGLPGGRKESRRSWVPGVVGGPGSLFVCTDSRHAALQNVRKGCIFISHLYPGSKPEKGTTDRKYRNRDFWHGPPSPSIPEVWSLHCAHPADINLHRFRRSHPLLPRQMVTFLIKVSGIHLSPRDSPNMKNFLGLI